MIKFRLKFNKVFWAKLLMRPESKKVRFDIQALRTLAVVAVVIYHIWPTRLPGGFMGVDIFFVISGYLMTLTIWKGVKAVKEQKIKKFNGSVKFLFNFYARRIKRLAPAATVCLLLILLAIFTLGNFGVQQSTASQVISSSIFMQNWHLAGEAVDYLGQDKAATATQHFWSLSIEEQFYMVWPLLLLVCGLVSALIITKSKRRFNKWGGVHLPSLLYPCSPYQLLPMVFG
jgi:peptidoglycan/LPS O-acetylase OafA/YrhL